MSDLSRAVWRKSTHSGGNGGECVEVAITPDVVGIRDSKCPDGGIITVSPTAWASFIQMTSRGRSTR